MRLAHIIDEYYDAFLTRYRDAVLPGQMKALSAMRSCRTPEAGQIYTACPDCNHTQWHPLSCGNRASIARTTKPANGLTDNKTSCFRFNISW